MLLTLTRLFILAMSLILPGLVIFCIAFSGHLLVSLLFLVFLAFLGYTMRREHTEIFTYLLGVVFSRYNLEYGDAIELVRIDGKGYSAEFTPDFLEWKAQTCRMPMGIVRNGLALGEGKPIGLWFINRDDMLHCKLRWS